MGTITLEKKIKELPEEMKLKVEGYVDALLQEVKSAKRNILAEPNALYERKPVFGSGKGFFGKMAEDFDEPLEDFKDYM